MKKKADRRGIKAATPVKGKTNYNYLLGGIVVLTCFLYYNCLHNDLLNFDDLEYFNSYPEVRNLSWEGIKKIFTGYYVIMYQPLPVLSFALNYHFTALDPMPLHLVNVLMHLCNIVLVYYFIKQLTGKPDIAIVVSVLFALHPMNVEAVSWMSARSSSMYVLFYLMALIQYISYVKKRQVKYLLFTGAFFILSLFSKAQAVTLPVILLAIDYFLARKLSWKLILEKIPFFILSVIFGLVTIMDSATMHNITNGMMVSYNGAEIFFMACYSFMFYFFKLVAPVSLCSVYVYPPKTGGMLPWEYYISPVFLLLIIYLLYRFRKNRYVILGAALFFITISINIQVIPSRLFIVTERYAYFPYIGLFFIAGYGYHFLKEKGNKYPYRFFAVLAVFCFAFSWIIVERNKVWANDLAFMTDIIEKNPKVPYLSRAYGNRGSYYLRNNMLKEAIEDYGNAIKVKPDDAQSYYNIAITYLKTNSFREALVALDSAKKYNPEGALIYSNIAFIKFQLKDYEGTVQAADSCIKKDPRIPEVYNTRAAIEYIRGEYEACEKDLDKAISLNDEYADAYKNRGILYAQTNRKEQACADFQKALTFGNPDAQELLNNNCR